jgi:hypothetical protein
MTIIKEKILEIQSKNSPEQDKYKQKIDSLGRSYATGKRKNAVAKVLIKKGSGKITKKEFGTMIWGDEDYPFLSPCIRSPMGRSFRKSNISPSKPRGE